MQDDTYWENEMDIEYIDWVQLHCEDSEDDRFKNDKFKICDKRRTAKVDVGCARKTRRQSVKEVKRRN